jgi:23S rRNA A2030 N6-methylase RlmJ
MAGSFGYHAGEHYDVSVAVAEHRLLPKLAEVDDATVVVADGFSCRGQIEQLAERPAQHIAQVVQRALRENGRTGPEALQVPSRQRNRAALALAGAAVVAGAAAVVRLRT